MVDLTPVPTEYEAGWAPQPVSTYLEKEKNLLPLPGFETPPPDRPAHSDSLYRLNRAAGSFPSSTGSGTSE